MFRLGGEVNTHGVGLTSGLNYNRPGYNDGGKVDPRPQGYMQGPDGKMREAHNPLLKGLVGGGINLIKALRGAASSRSLSPISKYIKHGDVGGPGLGPLRPTPAQIAKLKEIIARGGPGAKKAAEELRRTVGMRGFGPTGRFQQLGRATGIAGTAAAPFGLASGLFPRMSEEDRADPTISDARKNWDRLRGATEVVSDFNPWMFAGSVAGSAADAAIRSFGTDPDYSFETVPGLMQKTLYGGKPGPANVPKTPPMEQAMVQEEEFAALKADAEKRAKLYMELMGEEPDKMGAISRGLIQAGQLWDEDKGAAVGALGTEAGTETQRVRDLEKGLRGMAVEEVVGGDLAQQQALESAKINLISNPDLSPEMRSQGLKGIEAYEKGVKDILPLNANQDAAEGSKLSVGSVYYDPTNLYGGMYVAVSNNKNDPDGQIQGFDDVEEARAHARE